MSDDRTLTVLLTADQVRERVRELAAAINSSYPVGRDSHLVSVLKGAFIFLADLVRALDRPVTIDFVAIASYGASTTFGWPTPVVACGGSPRMRSWRWTMPATGYRRTGRSGSGGSPNSPRPSC